MVYVEDVVETIYFDAVTVNAMQPPTNLYEMNSLMLIELVVMYY